MHRGRKVGLGNCTVGPFTEMGNVGGRAERVQGDREGDEDGLDVSSWMHTKN